jgi:hypothetical protein
LDRLTLNKPKQKKIEFTKTLGIKSGPMANETKQNNMTIGGNRNNMIIGGETTKVRKVVLPWVFPDFECNICGDEYTMKTSITCPYCKFRCCKKCFDTYLLTTPGDTKCMSCKQVYDLDTVFKLCNKTTYKKYTDYKFEQVVQKDKSLFQESLIEIERDNLRKKAERIMSLGHKFREVQAVFDLLQTKMLDIHNIDQNIAENMLSSIGLSFEGIKKMRVRQSMKEVQKDVDLIYTNARDEMTGEKKIEEAKQNTFIKHCSVADCKGTLNNRWYCRLCETPHCNKCGELKTKTTTTTEIPTEIPTETTIEIQEEGERKEGDEGGNNGHICDPNLVQNLEEIKKNSKPCPKCGVAIFKTEGCDQMFCIVCHTAFSWKTLAIETGRIHNPHYYEILRKNSVIRREEGDIRPCDELVAWSPIFAFIEGHIPAGMERKKFEDIYRFVVELEEEYAERRYIFTNITFADFRKRYIKNEITEADYRRLMKLKYNKRMKKIELCQVLSITKIAISEELKKVIRKEDGQFMTRLTPRDYIETNILSYQHNVEEVINNTNKILLEIGEKYASAQKICFDTKKLRWNISKA